MSLKHSKDRTKTVLQKLVLGMLSTCFKYNINIDMVWIPGSENDKADFLSCIVDNDDWSISEYIYQIIEFNWGPHEVDWFASDHNFKLKVFYSRYWNMYSTGNRCIYGVNGLFVPPIFLIPRVLKYMRQ
jgi:hypothetical protein